jgi:hypothetical protein
MVQSFERRKSKANTFGGSSEFFGSLDFLWMLGFSFMLSSVFYDTIFGQFGRVFTFSTRTFPSMGLCLPWNRSLVLSRSCLRYSTSCPHVPLFSFLAEHSITPLNFGFAIDSVSTSSSLVARSRNSNQNTNISLYRRDQQNSQCANIDRPACSLLTKASMNDNYKCFCRLLISCRLDKPSP